MDKPKRIVVKIGTSSLTHSTGMLNLKWVESFIKVLSDIHNMGLELVLVTSGAIGVGLTRLGLSNQDLTIPQKQAAAAIGQSELINIYRDIFSQYGKTVGQLLLTREAVNIPLQRSNTENTFTALLSYGVIPIVNENDSTSTEELEFGDNDTLSAYVAQIIHADLLILMTDIDGLFDKNPREYPDARLIPIISEITDEIRHTAGGIGSSRGTGGMITKLAAAEVAAGSGIDMHIVNGRDPNILYEVLERKAVGTLFKASGEKSN